MDAGKYEPFTLKDFIKNLVKNIVARSKQFSYNFLSSINLNKIERANFRCTDSRLDHFIISDKIEPIKM